MKSGLVLLFFVPEMLYCIFRIPHFTMFGIRSCIVLAVCLWLTIAVEGLRKLKRDQTESLKSAESVIEEYDDGVSMVI